MLLVFGVLLSLVLAIQLWLQISSRLEELRSARLDNAIWTVTQLEVEFLELDMAVLELFRKGDVGAINLRRRFNVFYSRVDTLLQSPIYRESIRRIGNLDALSDIASENRRIAKMIDDSGGMLMPIADGLSRRVEALRPIVRQISTNGNFLLATQGERKREEVAAVLKQLTVVSSVLFASLAGLALLFFRLYVQNKRRARDNRQTSARLSTIVSTSPDAIVVTDEAGHIMEFNPAAEQILAMSRDKALGRTLSEFLSNPDGTAVQLPMQLEPGPTRRQFLGLGADGHKFPVEVSQGIARIRSRQVVVYFLRDITTRLDSERTLKTSRDRALAGDRAKSRFLAVMSHEMRTPLNGILGIVELMRDAPGRREDAHYLSLLQTSGQILLNHVNDVLDITQIEAAGVKLSNAPFDLDTMLAELIAAMGPSAQRRGNSLSLSRPETPLGWFSGDVQRLRQVLANLLGNAIKFTENGDITLLASVGPIDQGGSQVLEFHVSDTGVGIAEQEQTRIFDDFVRLDCGVHSQTEGTGLGLGITKRLISAMGGTIDVESIHGEGSLFWVTLSLPQVNPDDLVAEVEDEHPLELGRALRVLLVEDNPTNRFILREMLERDGHEVFEAVDGLEGVTVAQAELFDLILMDINMPIMGGIEATRRIRVSGASMNCRIVALTAHVMDRDAGLYREVGIDDVVPKPISRNNLRRVLTGNAAEWSGSSDRVTVDVVVLLQLVRMIGPVKADRMLEGVLDQGNEFVADLDRADALSPDEVLDMVHAFSGSAAMIGARRLRNTLSHMEKRLRVDTDVDIKPWVEPLQMLWDETQLGISEFREQQSAL
ncbi:ATP-binding protein [Thalassovita taeanensis]|uniref:ATP-binding protein n=1 Tax=Thalassovita taeanensis TaxID=657014 RepID=UPI001587942F|nr:ATP-binding protein [Thalassovita taeanensis]